VSVLAPGLGQDTRAFTGIPDRHQGSAAIAWKIVEDYTLYHKPLLTPGEMLLLVQDAWHRAQKQSKQHLHKVKEVDRYVYQSNSESTHVR